MADEFKPGDTPAPWEINEDLKEVLKAEAGGATVTRRKKQLVRRLRDEIARWLLTAKWRPK